MKAKEIWKKIENNGFKFYCVSCNRERRIHPPAKIGSVHFYLQILITTSVFTLLTYPWFGFKGFAFLVIPVGIAFEAFYRMKMRTAMICPDCEFDPVLYLVDRKKAAHQVEMVWRKKFEQKGFPYPDQSQGNTKVSNGKPGVRHDLPGNQT